MKTKFGHIQFNTKPENQEFYLNLFHALGWKTLYRDENMLGVGVEDGGSFWFSTPIKLIQNDYDGFGINHVGIQTSRQEEVDEVVQYLINNKIEPLFETPRHRPEFSSRDGYTYYQVMFESPDHLLFEVVYIGIKS